LISSFQYHVAYLAYRNWTTNWMFIELTDNKYKCHSIWSLFSLTWDLDRAYIGRDRAGEVKICVNQWVLAVLMDSFTRVTQEYLSEYLEMNFEGLVKVINYCFLNSFLFLSPNFVQVSSFVSAMFSNRAFLCL
jgi:hypothetical protein